MAATDFRSDSEAAISSNNVSVTKPAGTLEGDLLVAFLTLADSKSVTAPTGWVLREVDDITRRYVYTKDAGDAEPASYAWTWTNPTTGRAWIGCYEDAEFDVDAAEKPADGVSGTTITAPAVVATRVGRLIVLATTTQGTFPTYTEPGGTTARVTSTRFGIADTAIGSLGTTGVKTFAITPAADHRWGYSVAVKRHNSAPDAPTITTPTGGVSIDKDSANIFRWSFSDSDLGDSQSAYELRYRVVGDPTWVTTGQIISPNGQATIDAGTFTEDDYEWQVRTYDSEGAVGSWSSSSFFTAATVPTDLTITDPLTGSIISTSTYLVTWSTPAQTSYQIRRVADAAGVPDTGTVYFDSGERLSTRVAVRSSVVSFPTNNRDEHIQIRKKSSGLWSDWVSAAVSVQYTPPATPGVSVLIYQAESHDAALQIVVGNP